MNKFVIAEREKRISIIPLIISGIAFICCLLFRGEIDAKFIIAIIFGILDLFLGLYFLLIPQNAIEKKDDCLIINYLFGKTTIFLSDIEYVSTTELGEYYNRDNSFFSDIFFFKDIRRLTVSFKKEGILVHKYVLVKNASAVKTTIDALIKK